MGLCSLGTTTRRAAPSLLLALAALLVFAATGNAAYSLGIAEYDSKSVDFVVEVNSGEIQAVVAPNKEHRARLTYDTTGATNDSDITVLASLPLCISLEVEAEWAGTPGSGTPSSGPVKLDVVAEDLVTSIAHSQSISDPNDLLLTYTIGITNVSLLAASYSSNIVVQYTLSEQL